MALFLQLCSTNIIQSKKVEFCLVEINILKCAKLNMKVEEDP